MLDYCSRYYERQFITRENKNKAIMAECGRMAADYISSGKLQGGRMPRPAVFAGPLHLSEAYFCDLLRFETGKTLEEYISLKQLELAKQCLLRGEETPAAVARRLGFPSTQYFTFLFRKLTGVSPGDYRLSKN